MGHYGLLIKVYIKKWSFDEGYNSHFIMFFFFLIKWKFYLLEIYIYIYYLKFASRFQKEKYWFPPNLCKVMFQKL